MPNARTVTLLVAASIATIVALRGPTSSGVEAEIIDGNQFGRQSGTQGGGVAVVDPNGTIQGVLHKRRPGLYVTTVSSPAIRHVRDEASYGPVYQSAEFSEYVGLGVSPPDATGADIVEMLPDGSVNAVWLAIDEFNPTMLDLESHSLSFGVSCAILDIRYRAAGDYVVLLETDVGLEFERWILYRPKGARTAVRSIHTGAGLPAVIDPPIQGIVGGGPFVALDERSGYPSMRRAHLDHALPDGVLDYEVDPDGRHLYVVDGNGNLLRLDLTTSNSTTILSAAQASLSQGITSVGLVAEDGFGRCLIARSDGVSWAALIIDADNDGIFETVNQYTSVKVAYSQLPATTVGGQDI